MTLAQDTSQHTIHSLCASLKSYRHILLAISMGTWIFCPLVGVTLFLIHCQINVSLNHLTSGSRSFLNAFLIILTLFTVTIYISSFEPFGDTVTYIDTYKGLADARNSIWSNFEFEPISFFIPKYISILTNGNELSFLFIQSLTINISLTTYAIIFFSDFYPLIILINLMTTGYYFQLFWMRQFYSFIFIVPAVCVNSSLLTALLFLTSFYAHNSSLFYFSPLIIQGFVQKTYVIERLILKPLKKIFGIKRLILVFLIILLGLLPSLWNISLGFLGSTIFAEGPASQKLSDYAGDSAASFNQDSATLRAQLRVIIDYITISLFALGANFHQVKPGFYKWLFLFITMLIGYLGAIFFGFNLRLNALFFCLPGFFYMIPLYSGKMVGRVSFYTMAFLASLAFRLAFFFYSFLGSYQIGSYLTFWQGNPLFTPITSYFVLFFEFLTTFWANP